MTFKCTLAAGAAALALSGGFAAAQETTGSVRGVVTDEAGSPIGGASVVLRDNATGQVRSTTTNADGRFAVRNLSVSGDYSATVSASGYAGERVDGIDVFLGDSTQLTFDLASGGGDEIVVVGTFEALGADLATGPSSVFGLETLETAPVINRDIKDIVRLDPRVYLDPVAGGTGGNDGIQCAGSSPRFNSLTVDGIRLNDNFGLNSNGYPTERIPFSFDAIEQVAVELAPYDVEYGQFTSCNINAVTKSGTNEFHGGVFFDYTSDALRGDEADGVEIDNGDFDEYRYGINIGGPIIKDRLFFFAAYEKLEGAQLFGDNTPTQRGITDAEFAQIADIAANTYGYTVSTPPTSVDVEDEKILVKLDWNIVDGHRASFTYNYNDGFTVDPSDGDPDELPEFNHFYERGAELNSYVGSVYSDWTDRLSTEIRVGFIDLDNRQLPFGSLEDNIGEVQIDVGDTTVYLGPDDSRHANRLNYELWTYKAKADYAIGNHLLTVGFEREEFEVFNLFVQEVQSEISFDSIADFAAGEFSDFRYENAAGTNVVEDGAAEFGFEISSVYLQDEWQATDALNIVAGVRWDYYTSDDKPTQNGNFQSAYGFPNNDNLEGKSVLQPRFAFTYEANDDLTFRGGVGIFSGGNPNVWISNNYSNNGATLAECRARGRSDDCVGGAITNVNDFTYSTGSGRPLFDIPDEAIDFVANATVDGPVNALDPSFEIPRDLKYSLGFTYDFDAKLDALGDNYRLDVDLLYSDVLEAALVQPVSWVQTGTAPDGRPIYTGNTNDFLLTNTSNTGSSFVVSAALSKSHDFGLDWSVAYAYTDSTDANPMTSAVAFSNWQNFTRANAFNPPTATSDYEIAHNFVLRADYGVDFVQDYTTRFSLVGTISEGAPYSYTYGNASPFAPNSGFVDNALLYVPTGLNDPLVSYADTVDSDTMAVLQTAAEAQAGLAALIENDECLAESRGQIIDRNACTDDWWARFDLRVSQDLPGLRDQDRTEVFFVLENVGNFINSDWGVLRQQGFPGSLDSIDAEVVGNQLVYSNARSPREGALEIEPSLWAIRFGVRYDF